jgi:hypothetical protein
MRPTRIDPNGKYPPLTRIDKSVESSDEIAGTDEKEATLPNNTGEPGDATTGGHMGTDIAASNSRVQPH